MLATLPAEALAPLQQRRAAITPEQLQPLADHVQLLFFLAYDMEGYVFWSPTSATLRIDRSVLR